MIMEKERVITFFDKLASQWDSNQERNEAVIDFILDKGEIFKGDVTCLRGDELSRKIEAGEAFTVCDEYDRYKFHFK